MTLEFLFNTCAAIDAMYWVSSVNVTIQFKPGHFKPEKFNPNSSLQLFNSIYIYI